jgi:hypothetical protein
MCFGLSICSIRNKKHRKQQMMSSPLFRFVSTRKHQKG